jgi:hypothetical protein
LKPLGGNDNANPSAMPHQSDQVGRHQPSTTALGSTAQAAAKTHSMRSTSWRWMATAAAFHSQAEAFAAFGAAVGLTLSR